jgi:hypothetical protein
VRSEHRDARSQGGPGVASSEPARFLSAVGLSITARCPISCAHCIVEADRERTEEMSGDFAAGLLREAAAYYRDRGGAVIVTGGEPFFAPGLLARVLSEATLAGLVAVVVTNCYWAKSARAAVATLERHPGIGVLTFSTDIHHRRHVSLEKLGHAISAARTLGIPFSVAVCVENEEDRERSVSELSPLVEPERIACALTLPAGRAASLDLRTRPPTVGRCLGADYPIVFPDGRVIGCMGIVNGLPRLHPLLLGDARETPLQRLLRASERNVFVHAMRALGPAAFTDGAGGPAVQIPAEYARYGLCALCYATAGEPALLDQVRARLADPSFADKTAWARLYFLAEEEMPGEPTTP